MDGSMKGVQASGGKKETISPAVAAILMIAITVVLVSTLMIQLPTGSMSGGEGMASYGGAWYSAGTTLTIPADPIEIKVLVTIDNDMAYVNTTYVYVLDEDATAKISLPLETVRDLTLVIDGREVSATDMPNYFQAEFSRISVPLSPGHHVINVMYTVEGMDHYTINLPNTKYLGYLYIKVNISDEYTLDSGSFKPDVVKRVDGYTVYRWSRRSAVVKDDIYIGPAEKEVPDLAPLYLASYAALWFLSSGIIVAGVWKGLIRATNMSLAAPAIAAVGAYVTGTFIWWAGAIVGTALMVIIFLKSVRDDRKIIASLVIISSLPLSAVMPYGTVVLVSLLGALFVLLLLSFLPGSLGDRVWAGLRRENSMLKMENSRLQGRVVKLEAELASLKKSLREKEIECESLTRKIASMKKAEVRTANYCYECGRAISPDFSYCPHCGTALGRVVACRSCGLLIPVEFRFCPGCGKENPEWRGGKER